MPSGCPTPSGRMGRMKMIKNESENPESRIQNSGFRSFDMNEWFGRILNVGRGVARAVLWRPVGAGERRARKQKAVRVACESGSKLPHSKTLRESGCRAGRRGRNGHQRLSARKIQAHMDQDPEKFQIQDPI